MAHCRMVGSKDTVTGLTVGTAAVSGSRTLQVTAGIMTLRTGIMHFIVSTVGGYADGSTLGAGVAVSTISVQGNQSIVVGIGVAEEVFAVANCTITAAVSTTDGTAVVACGNAYQATICIMACCAGIMNFRI